MFVIVAYDIASNRKRTKVHKKLKNYLSHIQGSVFEGYLNETRIVRMVEEVRKFVDVEGDSLRVWKIPERMVPELVAIGLPEVTEKRTFHVV